MKKKRPFKVERSMNIVLIDMQAFYSIDGKSCLVGAVYCFLK